MLSEKEKREAADIAASESLRSDMRRLRENRRNTFMHNGKLDVDRYIEFVNDYNVFINHAPKPFKPIKDRLMKL
jgi:hypothetical protein